MAVIWVGVPCGLLKFTDTHQNTNTGLEMLIYEHITHITYLNILFMIVL